MRIKTTFCIASVHQWSSYFESNMAKFAVVILAAFAFQAASAGVLMHQGYQGNALGDYGYGLKAPTWDLHYHSYPTGKFDALFGQLQTVAQDLAVYFQRALPNDRLVIKTLVWQSRELAYYIDAIIERLQAETHNYHGQIGMVLGQIVGELREIQMQFHQIAAYTTDVYAVGQMKNHFYMTVQRTVAQLEKLVHLVQIDFDQTHGELYMIVQTLVADFLYAFQNIYSHVQYYGAYGQQSPKQLVFHIHEITDGLIGYLQGVTHFDGHRKYAIYEYVQHVGAIMSRIQEVEGTYGNVEIDAMFQHVYGKLRRVLVPFMQMMNTEHMENVEVIRMELIKELQFVAVAFEKFALYAHAGEHHTFFFEILGDYVYAIQHFRMQMQWGYQSYFGLYHSGFYGHTEFPGFFGKYGHQGLYHYGGLYGQSSYGLMGYQGYGQGLEHYGMQIQTLIRDLHHVFQTVSFDDVVAKQAFMHMMYKYVNHLEFIIERLYQYVNYSADSDVMIFHPILQNLKQYVWALKQFHSWEYSSVEMSTQFYMYIQKIAMEFEKMMAGFEYTHGSFYSFVQGIFMQYMTATHYLYRMLEHIHEYPQYGYSGPYSHQYYGDSYYGSQHFGKFFGGKYGQYYGQEYGLGKYGQQYGFDKYSYGLAGLSHYGKGYGYGYPSQYGYQSYGHYWPSTQYAMHAY